MIQETVGEDMTIIDSALPTAEELKKRLAADNLLNVGVGKSSQTFYVTDAPERAASTANLFLGKNINASIHKVDLKNL